MGALLHDKVTKKFTWSGQNRKDRETKYPFVALQLKSVLLGKDRSPSLIFRSIYLHIFLLQDFTCTVAITS